MAPARFERGVWRGFCEGNKVRQKRPLPTFLLCNSKGYGQHSSSFLIFQLNDRLGEKLLVLLIPLRLGLCSTQETKTMYTTMILFKSANYFTDPAPSLCWSFVKNQGNNWGISTGVLDFSQKKNQFALMSLLSLISRSVLSRFYLDYSLFSLSDPPHTPHTCTLLHFHFSLHPSPLISLKSETFISSFSCFIVQCISFSPFLIPGEIVCVCVLFVFAPSL